MTTRAVPGRLNSILPDDDMSARRPEVPLKRADPRLQGIVRTPLMRMMIRQSWQLTGLNYVDPHTTTCEINGYLFKALTSRKASDKHSADTFKQDVQLKHLCRQLTWV